MKTMCCSMCHSEIALNRPVLLNRRLSLQSKIVDMKESIGRAKPRAQAKANEMSRESLEEKLAGMEFELRRMEEFEKLSEDASVSLDNFLTGNSKNFIQK